MGWSDLYSLKYPPPPQCAARLVVKSRRKPDSTTRSGCFARVVIVAGVIAVAARVAVATLVEIRVCRWCLVAAGVIVIAASPNAEDFLVAGVPKDNPTVLAEVLVVALRKPNSNPEKCAVVGAGGIVVDVAVGVPPRFKKKEEETVAGASTRRNRIFTTEVDSGNQHPVWSANHVFTNVEENDFMASELEIMVWNYSNSQNHECLGKLVLESASLLNVNNQVQWYPLQNPNGYGRYDTHQSDQSSMDLESLKTSQRRNNSACLLPVSSGRLHGRRKSDCGNRSIPIDTLGLDPKVRRNSSLDRGGDQDPYSGGSYNYDNNSRRNSRLY
ncbi:unnamed protein product [Lepeophtheirus salmonis]|uniref:(salmon louse) hypothetical protein n=1 Tax=Lepeophtheirus salmonis TaxID=72036 RepID=A0A7R8CY10_LEPSM|nr:unnamed protein product [Lepeophtheirus salmonis]CAF2937841.1 unnamed protein product [Lepeophtheirus salmonis]